MSTFREELLDLVKSFNAHEVRYLLVGGFAVNFYGYPRSTGDIDLWIDPSESNKKRLLQALSSLNYDIDQLKSIKLEGAAPIDIPLQDFKIELIPFISTKLSFNNAFEHSIVGDLDGISIRIVDLKHLIQLKSDSSRMKDALDVQELKKRNEPK